MERERIVRGHMPPPMGRRGRRIATSLVAVSALTVGVVSASVTAAGAAGSSAGGTVQYKASPKASRPAHPAFFVSTGLRLLHSFTVSGGYVADGVAMRNLGYGKIHLTGIPAHAVVYKAFLVWNVLNTTQTSSLARGTFDGSPIVGNFIGEGGSPCWDAAANLSYVANVTRYVSGNGTYSLANFASGATTGATAQVDFPAPLLEGATLVVVYEDATSAPTTVQLYGGAAETQIGAVKSLSISGFTAGPTHAAKTTFIVGDGQTAPTYTATYFPTGGGKFNTTFATYNFTGHTHMTNPSLARYAQGNFWDTDTLTVSSLVAPGATSASASVTGGDDCLVWVGQVFSATAPLSAPTGVKATGGKRSVVLTWNRVPFAKSYAVYESTTPTGETYTAPAACTATVPHCNIGGLAPATKYYFTVVARAGTDASPPSTQVTATTS